MSIPETPTACQPLGTQVAGSCPWELEVQCSPFPDDGEAETPTPAPLHGPQQPLSLGCGEDQASVGEP